MFLATWCDLYIYICKMFLAQAHELSHVGKTLCTVYSKSWTWQMCFGSRVCFLRFDGVFCSKLTCIQITMQYPIVMANNIIASQYKILLILPVQLYRTSNTWSLLSTVCLITLSQNMLIMPQAIPGVGWLASEWWNVSHREISVQLDSQIWTSNLDVGLQEIENNHNIHNHG